MLWRNTCACLREGVVQGVKVKGFWVFVCVSLCFVFWSEFMILVIVAVDGDTAVIRDGPRHSCHPCDDASWRVIAQDGVHGLSVFPSATKDEDLTVAHRHATALLQKHHATKNVSIFLNRHQRPVILLLSTFRDVTLKQQWYVINTVCCVLRFSLLPVCWMCEPHVSSNPPEDHSRIWPWWDHRRCRSGCWGTLLWCSA